MKLYLITRKDDASWDEYRGHVIAAPSPKQARKMAAEQAADEDEGLWLTPKLSYCTLISDTSKYNSPTIVLSDYLAG